MVLGLKLVLKRIVEYSLNWSYVGNEDFSKLYSNFMGKILLG